MKNNNLMKTRIAFRYWTLGMAEHNHEYLKVLKAIEIAEKYHTGKRKDGTPEISHQYMIVMYLKTLYKFFDDPVAVFIVALLHDTYEDYEESEKELRETFPEYFYLFVRISKIRKGKKIPYEIYFGEMKDCQVCSLVKLADRISNISTMVGVFNFDKQNSYIEDLNNWFYPMLKHARKTFPTQNSAYENMKTVLNIQKDTILTVRVDCENQNNEIQKLKDEISKLKKTK